MTFSLLALFLVALTASALLARYSFQVRAELRELETDIATHQGTIAQLKGQLQSVVTKYNGNVKRWNEMANSMNVEMQRLAQYRTIADADTAAKRMRDEAVALSEKTKLEASLLLESAERTATDIKKNASDVAAAATDEAKRKSKALTTETEAIFNSATTQAAKMIAEAGKKAEEIAGYAYHAMQNLAVLEKAAKAMKNTVDGYGDQYIVPPQNLFDSLADDFGHLQAGWELKRARECVKAMVKNGTAAACDYAEAHRRETAIHFVVDAFNGKVDSILARAKQENAGKLAQQIRDAFALVNLNGKAFRDARITEAFLDARLDELKWAAAVQHLAAQEREEQRDVKEQAREEARAAKEIEKAMRESAKEEAVLEKAMAQAREQLEHATDEQKALYEARLAEMEQRLREAMERKDRARSMAEQTKRGHVYIISNIGSLGDDVLKIGLTRRWDPHDRVNELGGASVPFGFDVHAMILSENAPELEKKLHEHFTLQQVNKVNHRKEFFRVSTVEVRKEIENLGLNGVSWTMTAAAKEYRETLATEQKLAGSTAEKERWVSRQKRLEIESSAGELVGAGVDDE